MLPIRVMLAGLLLAGTATAQSLRVGVAISLHETMQQIASAYQQQQHQKIEITYGSSGQIEAQIVNGAAIDIFISAANKQVDDLISRKLALAQTRRVVAGNELVLVVPPDAKDPPDSFESLASQSVRRIAIGEPRTVPAGAYAAQVLQSMNLADKLTGRIVYGANVRQVLGYVERGEVSAGIVYSTDALQAGDRVKVVAIADSSTHDPVVYPAVVIKASANPEAAKRFLDFLATRQAQQILREHGFSTRSPTTQPAGHEAQ